MLGTDLEKSHATAEPSLAQLQSSSVWWSPCPDVTDTYCSFLNVPLDYSDPTSGETVSLALRMIPATAPPKAQLGYLFTNPGGPGGSGTMAVAEYGRLLHKVVQGRYNVISWDPRAVNLTAPALGCFETPGDANRFTRDIEHLGLTFENASWAAELSWTVQVDAFAQSLSQACLEKADQRMLRASSTAFTARDMKSIMEALGEDTVKYWGFSYGTILGATFSAMFPELVGRVVLDGVSDAQLYTQNMWEWGRSGMNDTRKVFDGFFSSCAESGPAGCAFARENATVEEHVKRYDALLGRLRDSPMPVGSSPIGPGVLTASDVQYTVGRLLPNMARLLAETERGNGSAMYGTANVASGKLGRKPPAHHSPFHRSMESSIASQAAVMCSDTDSRAIGGASVETLRQFMSDLRRDTKSPTADIWALWIAQCRHWGGKAIEAYRGPWTVKEGLKKTNFPIVFLSQHADPVTPLMAARKMQAGFGNESATLLVQNGFGHCSMAHPSLCTAKKLRAYFVDGVVPAYDTRCEVDDGFLFPHPDKMAPSSISTLSAEDAELRHAMWELSTHVTQVGMGPSRV
ncbi:hypothetical protein Rhopal_004120-T1 [Rhodotorula paludigena]|uniref:Proteinase n=1 Tax=Rhodotorula paludigena TaxID=86838 RepID=A0AAV5GR01_9BASI|nr:hypothetical protein Rhopal_004120-T1 [Rhodotorula paludigena]